MRYLRYTLLMGCALALAACGTTHAPETGRGGAAGGTYKVGEPYQVKGAWYYPHEDYSYDETGIASWYGDDFHGQRTANGEIYNKNELTAAHKTLPLPSLARVTNLDNGKSVVVRVNDRGPFSGTRLIDVSQRTADLLGFEKQGTAKVRVQVLADESKAIADAMRHYGGKPVTVADAGVNGNAAVTPVTSQPLDSPSPESAQLEPIKTTPQIHKELLATKPVAEVVQLKVTGANRIYVQAGAFTVLENASKLKHKLAKLGSVEVSNAIVNGTIFYRVRVGPVADVAQADNMVKQVAQVGAIQPRIVID